MFANLKEGLRLLNYERRVALPEGGWSIVVMLAVATLLYAVLSPWDRPDVMVFFGEPLPALLSGFLAARLMVPEYETGRLALLAVRRPLFKIWLLRFTVLMLGISLAMLGQSLLLHVFPPRPLEAYYVYLPVTGWAAAFFFAAFSSMLALAFRQPLAGEVWTLLWGGLSLMTLFPAREPYYTGIGPFFPFPIWFIHRRLTAFPQLRPWLQASARVPGHLSVLMVFGVGLVWCHRWALRRLQREGL